MPFWNEFRTNSIMQRSMIGINASVVGILLAAFYNPVWTSTVFKAQDLVFIAFFFLALQVWKRPPWLVVITGALLGSLFLN